MPVASHLEGTFKKKKAIKKKPNPLAFLQAHPQANAHEATEGKRFSPQLKKYAQGNMHRLKGDESEQCSWTQNKVLKGINW